MTNKLIKCAITLIGALTFSLAQASTLSDQEAGIKFFQMVRQQLPLSSDPLIQDYINSIGHRLASHSDRPDDFFYFFVIDSGIINAFAGPDGYIGVFAGLIEASSTESELAGVMAHEIAHVTQNHISRGQEKMSHLTIPMVAAMVAAIASGNSTIAVGGIAAATAGGAQYSINTTRGYEQEADAIGIQTLARAGFNPYGMPKFFQTLQSESRFDSMPPPILLDHQVTAKRIAEAEVRAKELATKKSHPSSTTYYLIKARIASEITENPRDFLSQAQQQYKEAPQSLYANYLLALAEMKNLHYQKALTLITSLEGKYPRNIILPYTQAEISYAQKNYLQAVNYLKKTYDKNDQYYPVIMFYAKALLRAEKNKQALALLQQYQTQFSDITDYWEALSKAYAANDNLIYAYISRSKAYQNLGDTRNAIIQMQMAATQSEQTDFTKAITSAELARLKKILAKQ